MSKDVVFGSSSNCLFLQVATPTLDQLGSLDVFFSYVS